VPAGGGFSVDVKTGPAPSTGFRGFQLVVQYTGSITFDPQAGLGESRWPKCETGFESLATPTASSPGVYTLGCKATPPLRTYKGVLANLHFLCKGSGTGQVLIVGGAGSNVSFYDRPSINGNRIFLASDPKKGKDIADAVVISCASSAQGSGSVASAWWGWLGRHAGQGAAKAD
jgi:hypothetical protein